MSKPGNYISLAAVSMEINSAISSLNMPPAPIEPMPEVDEYSFLSQNDKWAAHSVEHLQKASEILMLKMDKMKSEIASIVIGLKLSPDQTLKLHEEIMNLIC